MRGLVRSPQLVPLAFACLLSSGCGDDQVAADGDDTAGETAGDGDGDNEAGDGDGEPIPEGVPARGIHITEVEANQGTAVLIGKDGEWVGAEGRNAFMIRDRDTLIRTQHVVDDGWIPRDITGVLHLRDAEGNELTPRSRTFFVDGPSDPRNLTTNFFFSILAEEAQPGLSYWVELIDASGVDTGDLEAGTNVTPAGYELIGYELTQLEMKIMLVPIHYTWIDPPTLVEPTEEDLQLVHDDLLQMNPLQTVTLELHEPYEYDSRITNLGQLLSPMSALRGNEQPEPNVYYHALVDVRGPGVNMVAGIANLAGDTKSEASSRVAATVWFKQNDQPPAGSSGTLVHEIGHNQGLAHVFCPNDAIGAANPDPNYPHEDGLIGVFGFGIRNFRLFTPTGSHDYMTYCSNAWASDWTWNKTYRRIRTLTSWDYEGGAAPENVPLLVGTLFADGSEDWWVLMGPAPEREAMGAEHRIAVATGGEVVEELYTAVTWLSDDETRMVVAPLPVEVGEIEGIQRIDWRGEVHAIELASVHVDAGVLARQP